MLDKSPNSKSVNVPNDLAAHWMPFTANRAFKKNPRLLAGAKDMHYFTVDGRKIIDGASGMWCTNAGHGRTEISAAIAKQAEALDYAPPFQFGIPQAFELASRIAELALLMPEKQLPDTSKMLLCPMPGVVTSISVKAGDQVEAGQALATVEAMKMENVLRAERKATVLRIATEAGASLAVDELIMEFE